MLSIITGRPVVMAWRRLVVVGLRIPRSTVSMRVTMRLFWEIEFGVRVVFKMTPSVSRVLCSKAVLFIVAVRIS